MNTIDLSNKFPGTHAVWNPCVDLRVGDSSENGFDDKRACLQVCVVGAGALLELRSLLEAGLDVLGVPRKGLPRSPPIILFKTGRFSRAVGGF